MVEGIKDIMALKVLEKTLEAINKIVSDWHDCGRSGNG
jgi:hypothetical protein